MPARIDTWRFQDVAAQLEQSGIAMEKIPIIVRLPIRKRLSWMWRES